MRIYEPLRHQAIYATASLAAVCLATSAGCYSLGDDGAAEEPPRPTIRQVRAEWRAMERNGLLPLLESPLAPEEDLSARLDPNEHRGLSHPRETHAALDLLRETIAHVENENARDAFLDADRQRAPTRTETLKELFARRYDGRVAGVDVWSEWDRLYRAFGELDQDDWIERQRLHALEAMLRADARSTVPPLVEALREESDFDDPVWRTLISNFPGPDSEEGRPLWIFLQAELEPEGALARALLDRLAGEATLGGVPHPFADEAGQAKLRRWMESDDPHDFGLKKAILGNAKSLPGPVAEELVQIGEDDASPQIQIEALYRGCERNVQERRIRRLVEFGNDERYAATVRDRLYALGQGSRARLSSDPLQASREVVYQEAARLRSEVDATPEELTLLGYGTVQWTEGSGGSTDLELCIYSYRLPDVARIAEEDSTSAPELYPTAFEATRGYAVTFLGGAYLYSEEEVRRQKCETALDLAAMVHRDYMAYELGAAIGTTPVPEYAAKLVEKDWRWGELRVPLEFEEEGSSE